MTNSSSKQVGPELKACWCRSGTNALSVRANMDHGDFACRERGRYVFCSNCWTHGPTYTTDKEAVDGWNKSRTRVSVDSVAPPDHFKHVAAFLSEMAEIYSLDVELGDEMKVVDVCAALLKVSCEIREQMNASTAPRVDAGPSLTALGLLAKIADLYDHVDRPEQFILLRQFTPDGEQYDLTLALCREVRSFINTATPTAPVVSDCD